MIEITSLDTPPSLARTVPSSRPALRVGVVQHRWHPDNAVLRAELDEGIERAARMGATVVFLPELTLSRYPADTLPENDAAGDPTRQRPSDIAEDLLNGPTFEFRRGRGPQTRRHRPRLAVRRRKTPDGMTTDWASTPPSSCRPEGELLARTRKTHIPSPPATTRTSTSGRAPTAMTPTRCTRPAELDGARLDMPTCWDEWFPEVARLYSLGGRRAPGLPHGHRLRAGPPGLRHPAVVAAGHCGQRHCQRAVHGGPQPMGQRRRRSTSTVPPSSPIPTAGSSPRRRGTNPPCSSPTSTSTSAGTGSTLFPFLTTRRPDTYAGLTEPVRADAPLGLDTYRATAQKATA